MLFRTPTTARRSGDIKTLSAIALLALLQVALAPPSRAAEPTANVSYKQLMGERNERLTQLKQSNGDVFQEILKGQSGDRASLKQSNLGSAERREKEVEINQHYKGLIGALGVVRKEAEARIYATWKESTSQLQAGTTPQDTRWDAVDDELGDFAESFFSSISEQSEPDPQQQELAEHLRSCSPLEQQFEHPFTGDTLTRSVKGYSGEKCHYVEELPGNGRMECLYPQDKLAPIADVYMHPERFEGAEIWSHTEFVDGNPVSTTEYIIDGKAVFHPLSDSMDKGECQVLGYN